MKKKPETIREALRDVERAIEATRKPRYSALFCDGPLKGEIRAIPNGMNTIKVATLPAPSAMFISESEPGPAALGIVDETYIRVGHFAPCGRGQYWLKRNRGE